MAGEKRQITRSRVSYSCQKCRQRKVKCDKIHPTCGSCQKTGEECVYATNDSESRSNHDSHTTDTGLNKKRKQSLDNVPLDAVDAVREHDGSTGLEDQLVQLSILLNKFRAINGVPSQQSAKTSRPDSSTTPQDDIQTIESQLDPSVGAPPLTDGDENISPNLDIIRAQLDTLTDLLRVATQSNITGRHVTGLVTDQRLVSPLRAQTTINENPLHVPSDAQRNALFRCWLTSVHPILPIMDPSLVLIYYRAFHFWYAYGLEKGIPCPCDHFVPFIFAVYYAGMVSMSARGMQKWFPGIKRQELLQSAGQQFFKSLAIPTKMLSTPPVLAARVLMCYLCSPCDSQPPLTDTLASLVRTAYSCNFHREAPNEKLDTRLAESRRRLWWEVVNLDTMEATASIMPPMINHLYCDTAIPSEVKETRLDDPEAKQYKIGSQDAGPSEATDDPTGNDRSSLFSAIYLFLKARIALASSSRNLLSITLAAKQKTREDMMDIRKTLGEVARYVNSIIDRIPSRGLPEMGFAPEMGKPGQSLAIDHTNLWGEDLFSSELETVCGTLNDPEKWRMPYNQQHRQAVIAFHKFARVCLSMLIDQVHCFSYAPFLRNVKNRLWVSARQCALRHAHSCLRKFNSLAMDLELERFRWTWPRQYQPIHACIIILLDTYERPTSPEAARSRALFDQMLLLSSPEHGIVGGDNGLTSTGPLQESGIEAFAMLMQLRAKAWHKAGLDPSLLWTEQDQVDIGAAKPLTEADKVVQSMREDVVHNGSTTPRSSSSLCQFLRPVLGDRAKEYMHPSEAGIPDDIDASMAYVKLSEGVSGTNSDRRQYRRARHDQKTAPNLYTAIENRAPSQAPGDSVYRFKSPSDLVDVSDLIHKIKSTYQQGQKQQQQQQQPKLMDRREQLSDLSRQIATTSNVLTNSISHRLPFGSKGGAPLSDGTSSSLGNMKNDSRTSIQSSNNAHNHSVELSSNFGPYNRNDLLVQPSHDADSASAAAATAASMPTFASDVASNCCHHVNLGEGNIEETSSDPFIATSTTTSSKSAPMLNGSSGNSTIQTSFDARPSRDRPFSTIVSATAEEAHSPLPAPQSPHAPSVPGLESINITTIDNILVDGGTNGDHDDMDMSEMLNVDFDWSKWDEIFGQIMDDGFDEEAHSDAVLEDVWAGYDN